MPDFSDQKTILFVDDEESILEIAAEHFEEQGYSVLTAKNGLEAIEILENRQVDCCFTDINMPEMDGLELAEYIRKMDNTIPVVVMTGFPSLDNTIQTLKNGVVDFLIKPVNLNQMTICLKRVLRERDLFIKNILLNKEVENKKRLERINRELEKKVSELQVLNRIMAGLVPSQSGAQLFEHMLTMALEITPATRASFFIVISTTQMPVEIASISKSRSSVKSAVLSDELKAAEPSARFGAQVIDKLMDFVIEAAKDKAPVLLLPDTARAKELYPVNSFAGIPLMIRGSVFGVLAATTDEPILSFTEKDMYYLGFMVRQAAYLVENLALYENIYENLFSTLSALVKAVEARDVYTKEHSSRVTEVAKIMARKYGCSEAEIDILEFSGRLHDIGKIGIRDDILLKPGPLSPEEFEIIKTHPVIGENIIAQLGLWDRERRIIRHHHERFDGYGYPDGLSGEEIPLLARILSIADVYDAMISKRAYRKALSDEQVAGLIYSQRGLQFDPRLVELFHDLHESGAFHSIYEPLRKAAEGFS